MSIHAAGPPTPARSCAAGILFAVAIEADAFERLATDRVETLAGGLVFHEGFVAGRRVAWCVGGVGAEAAARAARLLIDGHRPALVVSAGFAGGLDPSLVRGTVARPDRSVRHDGGEPIPLAAAARRAAVEAESLTIVTADGIVRTPDEKRALLLASGARLVDMETHAVAGVARAAGLPCGSIRVISDDASQELPREVAALARPQSAFRRLGAAIGAVGRRPRAAIDLWRLYEHGVVDAKSLAAALEEFCRSLPAEAGPSRP
ncbi:MAG: hypothetical protein EBZ59_10745 [Planctomycetia bacterium]|nr:hypothetical protein [Planctomycetia bacterium]